jgi:hypothetical protein
MNYKTPNQLSVSAHLRAAGLLLCAAGALAVVSGCKTKGAADSGFLEYKGVMAEDRARFPFHRVWVKPNVVKENYDYILVTPVNTAYLMKATGWKAANPGNLDLERAAQELAEFTQKTFIEAFNNPENNRFRVTTTPGPRTLGLDLAITELVPSKAALNALSLASPNIGMGVAAGVAAGTPSTAIEGRLVDTATGETLFQFADREEAQIRIVNLEGLTWWSHARDSVRNWANQCVTLANTPKDQKVKDRLPFTLKPW